MEPAVAHSVQGMDPNEKMPGVEDGRELKANDMGEVGEAVRSCFAGNI